MESLVTFDGLVWIVLGRDWGYWLLDRSWWRGGRVGLDRSDVIMLYSLLGYYYFLTSKLRGVWRETCINVSIMFLLLIEDGSQSPPLPAASYRRHQGSCGAASRTRETRQTILKLIIFKLYFIKIIIFLPPSLNALPYAWEFCTWPNGVWDENKNLQTVSGYLQCVQGPVHHQQTSCHEKDFLVL